MVYVVLLIFLCFVILCCYLFRGYLIFVIKWVFNIFFNRSLVFKMLVFFLVDMVRIFLNCINLWGCKLLG